MARPIAEGVDIGNANGYAHAMAQFVPLESARDDAREASVAPATVPEPRAPGGAETEALLQRLEECLDTLEIESREIILAYYRGPAGGMRSRALQGRGIMRDYLLDLLSDTQREEVEERLFMEPEFFDDLLDAEIDLRDAYVRGGLRPVERQSFETRFVAGRGAVDALRLARGLELRERRTLARAAAQPAPWSSRLRLWIPSAALAASRLLAAGPSPVFSFVLEPGLVRGGTAPAVAVPAARLIWVRLVIADPAMKSPVEVSVLDRSGQPWHVLGPALIALVEDTRVAEVAFPAALIPSGDHQIHIAAAGPPAREAVYPLPLRSCTAAPIKKY